MRFAPVALACLSLMAATALGCSGADEREGDGQGDDEEALQLREAFSNAVTDLGSKLAKTPCAWLEKIGTKDNLAHVGFFYGYQVDGSVGVLPEGSIDYVWDLYDQQVMVTRHRGAAFLPKGTANAGAHAGVMYGFKNTVAEFQGHFASTNITIGIPFANDILGAGVGGFAITNDANHDGKTSLNEIDKDGIFGFVVTASAAFDKAPVDKTQVASGIAENMFVPAIDAMQVLQESLKKEDIDVGIVDSETGQTCSATASIEGRDCVVGFGTDHTSHFLKARALAKGLKKHAGKLESMVGPIGSTALAIGALRDLASGGRSLEAAMGRLCPQNKAK